MSKGSSGTHGSSSARILGAALDLFAVKGYDATAVREVCEAAGVTKPTLYHFYGSKDGVLRALLTSGFERFRRLVDSAMASPGSFRDRAKLLARSIFESARGQPLFWRFMHSIVWAPPGTAPSQTAQCTEFYNGVVGVLAAAAEDATQRGELAPGRSDVRMLVLMGAMGEAATGYVISGKPELTPELADRLIDTILDGWVRQSTVGSRQSTGDSRESTVDRRQSGVGRARRRGNRKT